MISPMIPFDPLNEFISVSWYSSDACPPWIPDYPRKFSANPPGIDSTVSVIFFWKRDINYFKRFVSPYKPFNAIFLQHLTSFTLICSLIAEIADYCFYYLFIYWVFSNWS